MAGLYTILEYIRNAFRINLLPLIRIHLVIFINKLYKAANNLLPSQL
jgi:hypothetical protein